MFDKSGESGLPSLVPDLRGRAESYSSLCMMLAVSLTLRLASFVCKTKLMIHVSQFLTAF